MFPGQGAQYVGMARGLYQRLPTFRSELDRCAKVLSAENIDLIGALYGPSDLSTAERLARTEIAQPAIFSVSYALARQWQSWGVNAQAHIGHSVGEFVAACLAGVFSLTDALRLIAARGRLMQQLPTGGMLSVRLSEAEVASLIGDGVALAAINSPTNVVLAGPREALQAAARQLEARGTAHRWLHTSHAFHSPMMDPMIGPFTELIGWRHSARAHDAVCLERNRRLDPARGGNIARVLGATRTRTRSLCSRNQDTRQLRPIDSVGGWARRHAVDSRAADSARPGRPGLRIVARGRRAVGRRRDDARCLGKTVGQRRHARLGRPSRTVRAHACRCRPIPSSAAVTGSMRLSGERQIAAPAFSSPPAIASVQADTAAVSLAESEQTREAEMDGIRESIAEILQDVSGETIDPAATLTFLELGFDSLLLSQVAQQIQRRLKVKIAFRQLLGDLSTIPALERFIRAEAPAEVKRPVATAAPAAAAAVVSAPETAFVPPSTRLDGTDAGIAAIMRAQVEAMSSLIQGQLDALKRLGSSDRVVVTTGLGSPSPPSASEAQHVAAPPAVSEAEGQPSRFQVYRAGVRGDGAVTPSQRRHIDALAARLTAKTGGSKQRTAAARPTLADPRAAAGFRPEWKELVYPSDLRPLERLAHLGH